MGAGRPPAKILTEHFNRLEKQTNKSNRWFYQCKYCGSEPHALGAQIENRDNKPLKHLQKCNKAPQSARSAARMQLAAKAIELVLPDSIEVSTSTSTVSNSPSTNQDFQTIQATGSTGSKRLNGSLIGYADIPLTKQQQERANIKLFRYSFNGFP